MQNLPNPAVMGTLYYNFTFLCQQMEMHNLAFFYIYLRKTVAVMRLCELKQKEIINTCTCRCLGCPIDVEFDCKTGQITALVVPGPGRLCSFLEEKASM